jgi:hypothetical protein
VNNAVACGEIRVPLAKTKKKKVQESAAEPSRSEQEQGVDVEGEEDQAMQVAVGV